MSRDVIKMLIFVVVSFVVAMAAVVGFCSAHDAVHAEFSPVGVPAIAAYIMTPQRVTR